MTDRTTEQLIKEVKQASEKFIKANNRLTETMLATSYRLQEDLLKKHKLPKRPFLQKGRRTDFSALSETTFNRVYNGAEAENPTGWITKWHRSPLITDQWSLLKFNPVLVNPIFPPPPVKPPMQYEEMCFIYEDGLTIHYFILPNGNIKVTESCG